MTTQVTTSGFVYGTRKKKKKSARCTAEGGNASSRLCSRLGGECDDVPFHLPLAVLLDPGARARPSPVVGNPRVDVFGSVDSVHRELDVCATQLVSKRGEEVGNLGRCREWAKPTVLCNPYTNGKVGSLT
jgi:hypothetical protein